MLKLLSICAQTILFDSDVDTKMCQMIEEKYEENDDLMDLISKL